MTTILKDASNNSPEIRRGETITWVFPVTDQSLVPPSAKLLTGATEVSLSISASRQSTTPDLTLGLGSGTSHDDAGGNITVTITKAQSVALVLGRRWVELWVTDAAGRRELVGEGAVLVYDTAVEVAA